MVGNAVPVIKKHIKIPLKWIIKNKLRVMMGKEPELCFSSTEHHAPRTKGAEDKKPQRAQRKKN